MIEKDEMGIIGKRFLNKWRYTVADKNHLLVSQHSPCRITKPCPALTQSHLGKIRHLSLIALRSARAFFATLVEETAARGTVFDATMYPEPTISWRLRAFMQVSSAANEGG